MNVMQKAGKKAAITRKLNKQLKSAVSKTQAAAFKAHATRKVNAL